MNRWTHIIIIIIVKKTRRNVEQVSVCRDKNSALPDVCCNYLLLVDSDLILSFTSITYYKRKKTISSLANNYLRLFEFWILHYLFYILLIVTIYYIHFIMFVSQNINHFIYLYYIIFIIIIQHCNKLVFNEIFRKI